MAASCCLILLSACDNKADNQQKTSNSYKTLTIDTSNVDVSECYPATIQGRQDIDIYPQVSGTISKVNVKEGQKVNKGQSLFIIDQVPFEAALQMAKANTEAAEAGVASAQLTYDSRVELYKKDIVSEYDMLTAKNQLLAAKATLAQAQAQLVNAENNMAYTQVLSPADGVIGTIPFREGALVSPSIQKPLTTVSDNSQMYVYYTISERKLLELTAEHGNMDEVIACIPDVSLELADGSTYAHNGKVEAISGVIDPNTASVSVRAVFPNKGGILHSGASGRIVVKKDYRDAIVIPCSSTYELQDLICAYKVIDGKASFTRLTVRLTDDNRHYIVTSGLRKGDVIVNEGVGLISNGQTIISK